MRSSPSVGAMVTLFILLATGSCLAQTRVIELDLNQPQGPLHRFFNTSVGAGRANEGLRADWQQQLALVKQDAGFRYIRMHGLLSDDMAVYKVGRSGEELYNFQYVDALFDYLLSIDIKPFVELGFMPQALASGEKTIFWWRGNVTPPYDYERWGKLIEALVRHFTERYGSEEVASWYFEVWNEPNLDGFWAGSQAEYFKLYTYAANAVKRVDPSYKVGGPATAGAAWIPEMIAYCAENKVPLDFVSTHSYGVEQGFLDEFGSTGTVLSANPMAVSGDVLTSRQQITESAMPHLELHYTEWSASYTPADPIHDSYHSAAYILQKLKQTQGAAQSMSYWVFTDIFEEAGPRFEAFHGGFGLMNTQGIKKPAYFAYQFLNQLGGTELHNEDAQSIATLTDEGEIRLLLWDYTYTLPEGVNNQQYYVKDLPAKAKTPVKLNIKGMTPGDYEITQYRVGYRQNDAYTGYLDMGSPTQLNRQQVETLKSLADGSPAAQSPVAIGDREPYRMTLPLNENEVALVVIRSHKVSKPKP